MSGSDASEQEPRRATRGTTMRARPRGPAAGRGLGGPALATGHDPVTLWRAPWESVGRVGTSDESVPPAARAGGTLDPTDSPHHSPGGLDREAYARRSRASIIKTRVMSWRKMGNGSGIPTTPIFRPTGSGASRM